MYIYIHIHACIHTPNKLCIYIYVLYIFKPVGIELPYSHYM